MSEDPFPRRDDSNPYANLEGPGRREPWHEMDPSDADEGRPRVSGLGITSMILGILLLCVPLAGLVPLIMGIVSLVKIRNAHGRLTGKGFGIAGIALGGTGTLLSCCTGTVFFYTWSVFGGPNTFAAQLVDEHNLTAIRDAMDAYAHTNGEYPDHVGRLVDQNYVPTTQFLSLPGAIKGPPSYFGPPTDPEPVYRFGDYIFAFAGQGDPGSVPPDAVLAYSRKIDPNQLNRHVLLGSGDIIYESDVAFRKRIETENQRRREIGEQYVIDVDTLDGQP